MKYVIFLVVLLMLICTVSMVFSSVSLRKIEYTAVMPGLDREVRTVLLSDMHNREFGRDNARLMSELSELRPEAIFACGDIIGRNAGEPEIGRMLHFLAECSRIAPTYYVRGNHETGLIYSDFPDLLDRIAEVCTVLNDSWKEIELGNVRVALGGTKGTTGYLSEPDGQSVSMLSEMIDSGLPMIVMSHKPDAVVSSEFAKGSGALFLSGHTHGGLWRLPFIGGLIAPGQGLFPEYDMGSYEFDNGTRMIISSGMYGYAGIPRLFNRPEITIIDFVRER